MGRTARVEARLLQVEKWAYRVIAATTSCWQRVQRRRAGPGWGCSEVHRGETRSRCCCRRMRRVRVQQVRAGWPTRTTRWRSCMDACWAPVRTWAAEKVCPRATNGRAGPSEPGLGQKKRPTSQMEGRLLRPRADTHKGPWPDEGSTRGWGEKVGAKKKGQPRPGIVPSVCERHPQSWEASSAPTGRGGKYTLTKMGTEADGFSARPLLADDDSPKKNPLPPTQKKRPAGDNSRHTPVGTSQSCAERRWKRAVQSGRVERKRGPWVGAENGGRSSQGTCVIESVEAALLTEVKLRRG